MLTEQVRRGALVDGSRVVGMTVGRVNRRSMKSFTLADGRVLRCTIGRPVPGTGPRTDLPAGPVGAGRGMRSTGAGWRDGESSTDRNARRIDAIVYGR